jgi:NAD(P)-dependent dehydrogenase (short-subunit alcohol dehydrogenase family)
VELNGKVAVVTGAANGIGAATARKLAALGTQVVVADIDEKNGSAVAGELGGNGRFKKLDVTSLASYEGLYEEVGKELGGIDIVHLNAGVLTRGGDDPEPHDYVVPYLTEPKFRKVESINIDGVVFGTIAAVPHLEARGGGQLVMGSSPAGLGGWAADPFYALSKAAVNSWTQAMGAVLAEKNIRANGVMPGAPVDTAMFRPQWKEHPDLQGATIVTPESMADAIIELMQRDDTTGIVYLLPATGGVVPVVGAAAQG